MSNDTALYLSAEADARDRAARAALNRAAFAVARAARADGRCEYAAVRAFWAQVEEATAAEATAETAPVTLDGEREAWHALAVRHGAHARRSGDLIIRSRAGRTTAVWAEPDGTICAVRTPATPARARLAA